MSKLTAKEFIDAFDAGELNGEEFDASVVVEEGKRAFGDITIELTDLYDVLDAEMNAISEFVTSSIGLYVKSDEVDELVDTAIFDEIAEHTEYNHNVQYTY